MLSPIVEGRLVGDDQFGGALSTTLLLALATPLILLPTERIVKWFDGKTVVADETGLIPRFTDKLNNLVADNKPVSAEILFSSKMWSYCSGVVRFDAVGIWPNAVLADLASPTAVAAGQAMSMTHFAATIPPCPP